MFTATKLKQTRIIVPATIATVAAAFLLPFLVHLLPPVGNVPIGARLLPLFHCPLFSCRIFSSCCQSHHQLGNAVLESFSDGSTQH